MTQPDGQGGQRTPDSSRVRPDDAPTIDTSTYDGTRTRIAERMRERAERETARAESAVKFLTEALESVGNQDFDHEPTIADLLTGIDRSLEGAFPDDPLTEASVRQSVAWAWAASGNWGAIEAHLAKAIELRRRAGAKDDETTIKLLNGLGSVYDILGETDKRVQVYEELVRVA